MQKSFRKAMLSTICMLIVAVMSLTGVTYAWFSAATTAKVDGFKMDIGAAGAGLQVSETGSNTDSEWYSTINFTDATKTSVLPVSTVDAKNFFTADVDVNNSDTITAIRADGISHIITKDLYMRNTGNGTLTVQLDAASFANVFATTSTGNKAEVIKAARIAVFQDENLLWVYGDIDHTNGIAKIGTAENFPYSVTTEDEEGVVVKLDTNKFVSDATKCTITVPGERQVVSLKLVVWFEGQDPQCDNDVALSNFTSTLNFKVIADTPATQG